MNLLKKERIEKRLDEMKKNKTWLAYKMGMQLQSLSRMLGANNQPRLKNIIELSKILNLSIDYLLGITDEASTNVELKDISKRTKLSVNTIKTLSCLGLEEISLIEDFIKMIKERNTK